MILRILDENVNFIIFHFLGKRWHMENRLHRLYWTLKCFDIGYSLNWRFYSTLQPKFFYRNIKLFKLNVKLMDFIYRWPLTYFAEYIKLIMFTDHILLGIHHFRLHNRLFCHSRHTDPLQFHIRSVTYYKAYNVTDHILSGIHHFHLHSGLYHHTDPLQFHIRSVTYYKAYNITDHILSSIHHCRPHNPLYSHSPHTDPLQFHIWSVTSYKAYNVYWPHFIGYSSLPSPQSTLPSQPAHRPPTVPY